MGHDFIGLHLAQKIPAGRASIIIDYQAAFERADPDGVFRVRDGDNWYVYTQFEPVSARRAFPCFDEPRWKTSWSLELTVPGGDRVVANSPVATQETLSATQKRVRFMPTQPLPSYLVAFAVGPFDIVDGGSAGHQSEFPHFRLTSLCVAAQIRAGLHRSGPLQDGDSYMSLL